MVENGTSRYFIELQECPMVRRADGIETRVLTGLRGERMMMVLNYTKPGQAVPTHKHPHEQIGMVFGGEAILRIGDEEMHVKRGDFYCIPPNTPHSDETIGDEPFIMLDIFCPVREDIREKLVRD